MNLIGQQLKEAREKQGKKAEYLASRLGVNKSTFSLMEDGQRNIPQGRLAAWCELLGKKLILWDQYCECEDPEPVQVISCRNCLLPIDPDRFE